MAANDRQVGGEHYKQPEGVLQHWDLVVMYGWDYFTGQVTKYLMRWRLKNGLEDLKKARHYLDKLIEEVESGRIKAKDFTAYAEPVLRRTATRRKAISGG